MNSQQWLDLAYKKLTAKKGPFTVLEMPKREEMEIRDSLPTGGATRGKRTQVVGQHYPKQPDGRYPITVSPAVGKVEQTPEAIRERSLSLLATLAHEMVHCHLQHTHDWAHAKKVGHGGEFKQACAKVGVEPVTTPSGKVTYVSTKAGPELTAFLVAFIEKNGECPLGVLDVTSIPKQEQRTGSLPCPECSQLVRVSKKGALAMPACGVCTQAAMVGPVIEILEELLKYLPEKTSDSRYLVERSLELMGRGLVHYGAKA